MEELLELQKVKEKEQIVQMRSLKEATAEVKKQKYSQDEISQKVCINHRAKNYMHFLLQLWVDVFKNRAAANTYCSILCMGSSLWSVGP